MMLQFLSAGLALAFLSLSVTFSAFANPSPQSEWTVFVYLSGDNNLSDLMTASLDAIKNQYPKEGVNVLVQFDGNRSNDSLRLKLSHSPEEAHEVLSSDIEYDMGDESTLADFVAQGQRMYPAQHYALLIFAHGRGILNIPTNDGSFLEGNSSDTIQSSPRYISLASSPDDSSGSYMDEPKMTQALAQALGDKNLDVMVYESCLMGNFEVLSYLDRVADYVVASEYTIMVDATPNYDTNLGKGLTLHRLIQQLGDTNTKMAPTEFATMTLNQFEDNYRDFYLTTPYGERQSVPSTLSIYDTKSTERLARSLRRVSDYLLTNPELAESIFESLFQSLLHTSMVHTYGYIDLGHLLALMKKAHPKPAWQRLVLDTEAALDRVIYDRRLLHVSEEKSSKGLSIFFPSVTKVDSAYDDFLNNYSELETVSNLLWSDLIERFHHFHTDNRLQLLTGLVERVFTGEFIKVRPSDDPDYNEYFLFLMVDNELSRLQKQGRHDLVDEYVSFIMESNYSSPAFTKHREKYKLRLHE